MSASLFETYLEEIRSYVADAKQTHSQQHLAAATEIIQTMRIGIRSISNPIYQTQLRHQIQTLETEIQSLQLFTTTPATSTAELNEIAVSDTALLEEALLTTHRIKNTGTGILSELDDQRHVMVGMKTRFQNINHQLSEAGHSLSGLESKYRTCC